MPIHEVIRKNKRSRTQLMCLSSLWIPVHNMQMAHVHMISVHSRLAKQESLKLESLRPLWIICFRSERGWNVCICNREDRIRHTFLDFFLGNQVDRTNDSNLEAPLSKLAGEIALLLFEGLHPLRHPRLPRSCPSV